MPRLKAFFDYQSLLIILNYQLLLIRTRRMGRFSNFKVDRFNRLSRIDGETGSEIITT